MATVDVSEVYLVRDDGPAPPGPTVDVSEVYLVRTPPPPTVDVSEVYLVKAAAARPDGVWISLDGLTWRQYDVLVPNADATAWDELDL